jgi:hypothetical protein
VREGQVRGQYEIRKQKRRVAELRAAQDFRNWADWLTSAGGPDGLRAKAHALEDPEPGQGPPDPVGASRLRVQADALERVRAQLVEAHEVAVLRYLGADGPDSVAYYAWELVERLSDALRSADRREDR